MSTARTCFLCCACEVERGGASAKGARAWRPRYLRRSANTCAGPVTTPNLHRLRLLMAWRLRHSTSPVRLLVAPPTARKRLASQHLHYCLGVSYVRAGSGRAPPCARSSSPLKDSRRPLALRTARQQPPPKTECGNLKTNYMLMAIQTPCDTYKQQQGEEEGSARTTKTNAGRATMKRDAHACKSGGLKARGREIRRAAA